MFWTWIFIAVVMAFIGLLIAAALLRREDYTALEYMVYELDWDEARRRHAEAKKIAARRFIKNHPMPIDGKEYRYYLEMAILTRDRINELEGQPNGPSIRRKWRRALRKEIREMAAPLA